jgi:hypothetical protein
MPKKSGNDVELEAKTRGQQRHELCALHETHATNASRSMADQSPNPGDPFANLQTLSKSATDDLLQDIALWCIALRDADEGSHTIAIDASGTTLFWVPPRPAITDTTDPALRAWIEYLEAEIAAEMLQPDDMSRDAAPVMVRTDLGDPEDCFDEGISEGLVDRVQEGFLPLHDTLFGLRGDFLYLENPARWDRVRRFDSAHIPWHSDYAGQISAVSNAWDDLDEADRECPICLERVTQPDGERAEAGVEVAALVPWCGHVVGAHCLRKWILEAFMQHHVDVEKGRVAPSDWSPTCPCCRGRFWQDVEEDSESDSDYPSSEAWNDVGEDREDEGEEDLEAEARDLENSQEEDLAPLMAALEGGEAPIVENADSGTDFSDSEDELFELDAARGYSLWVEACLVSDYAPSEDGSNGGSDGNDERDGYEEARREHLEDPMDLDAEVADLEENGDVPMPDAAPEDVGNGADVGDDGTANEGSEVDEEAEAYRSWARATISSARNTAYAYLGKFPEDTGNPEDEMDTGE